MDPDDPMLIAVNELLGNRNVCLGSGLGGPRRSDADRRERDLGLSGMIV